MATETSGQGVALLKHLLTESKTEEGKTSFDPASILAILAAILPLIQNCLKPKPSSLRRRFGNRLRLAVAIQGETGDSWSDSLRQADEVFRLADKASDAELQMLIDDCKQ